MQIIFKKISELKPYRKNAKIHNDDQISKLANSIKSFGFNVPVLIDSKNEIISGHGRVEAAKKLKLSEVPCILISNLTEKQVKAYRIADNKLSESEWDMALVLKEFSELDLNLQELTGFDNNDFALSEADGAQEVDIDNNLKTTHECPKCGFEF